MITSRLKIVLFVSCMCCPEVPALHAEDAGAPITVLAKHLVQVLHGKADPDAIASGIKTNAGGYFICDDIVSTQLAILHELAALPAEKLPSYHIFFGIQDAQMGLRISGQLEDQLAMEGPLRGLAAYSLIRLQPIKPDPEETARLMAIMEKEAPLLKEKAMEVIKNRSH